LSRSFNSDLSGIELSVIGIPVQYAFPGALKLKLIVIESDVALVVDDRISGGGDNSSKSAVRILTND
jgi:hypothetical protein